MQKLNFVTCLKTDVLPILPPPYTLYIIKDADNNTYEIKISDESSNYLILQNSGGTGINTNTVISYRSSYDDNYIYSGFLLNNNIVIKRCKDNIEELAQNTNNLDNDWINRLTLNYI